MGVLFIIEGVILFVVVDLFWMILSFIVGSVIIGVVVMFLNIKVLVFYGGVFVIFFVF